MVDEFGITDQHRLSEELTYSDPIIHIELTCSDVLEYFLRLIGLWLWSYYSYKFYSLTSISSDV